MSTTYSLQAKGHVPTEAILSAIEDSGHGPARVLRSHSDEILPLWAEIGFADADGGERFVTLTHGAADRGDDPDDDADEGPDCTLVTVGPHGSGPAVIDYLASRLGGVVRDERDGSERSVEAYPSPAP